MDENWTSECNIGQKIYLSVVKIIYKTTKRSYNIHMSGIGNVYEL